MIQGLSLRALFCDCESKQSQSPNCSFSKKMVAIAAIASAIFAGSFGVFGSTAAHYCGAILSGFVAIVLVPVNFVLAHPIVTLALGIGAVAIATLLAKPERIEELLKKGEEDLVKEARALGVLQKEKQEVVKKQQENALTVLVNYKNVVTGDPFTPEQQTSLTKVLKKNPKLSERLSKLVEEDPNLITGTPDGTLVNGLTQGVLNPATKINDFLYAGSISDGLNPPEDVEVIINFSNCYDLEPNARGKISYHTYKIDDTHQITKQMEDCFEDGVRKAIDAIRGKKKVLVHCVEGKNRTGVAVAVILALLSNVEYEAGWNKFYTNRGWFIFAKPTEEYVQMGKKLFLKLKNRTV